MGPHAVTVQWPETKCSFISAKDGAYCYALFMCMQNGETPASGWHKDTHAAALMQHQRSNCASGTVVLHAERVLEVGIDYHTVFWKRARIQQDNTAGLVMVFPLGERQKEETHRHYILTVLIKELCIG